MANQQQLLSILPQTGGADSISKGGFLQNVLVRRDGFEIRPGFGQLGEWTCTSTQGIDGAGFQRQLGCTSILTDFGHTQVVSLWVVKMPLRQLEQAQERELNLTQDGIADVFLLQVYDVTTNRRWEEVLYLHTADSSAETLPMPYWRPHYTGRSRWLIAGDEQSCFFQSAYGVLFFGNDSMGAWCYVPADFRDQTAHLTNQQVGMGTAVLPNDWKGESCRVFRVQPQPRTEVGVSYIGEGLFPEPVDACLWGGRMVYASGRILYFSDPLYPASVSETNLVELPMAEEITAIGECSGIILVWSGNETWAFRPGSGASAAVGDARRLSDSIGCIGPLGKIRRMEQLVWCDTHGIYAFDGGMGVTELSEPIRGLFDEGMSLPLSRFYDTDGSPQSASTTNSSFLLWTDTDRINVAYNPLYDVVLFAIPDQNAALCLSQGNSWSVWTFESFAVNSGPVSKQMPQPYLCNGSDSVFMSIGPLDTTIFDYGGNSSTIRSNAILQWREGGALDRNSAIGTDHRAGYASVDRILAASNRGWFYIGRPTLVPAGSNIVVETADEDTWLFPVYLCSSHEDVDGLKLHFTFDENFWLPVLRDAGNGDLDIDVPAQRLAAVDIFGYPNINVGTNETRLYGSNEIRINAIGATAGAAWGHKPSINVPKNSLEPILWLPFVPQDKTIAQPASLCTSVITAQVLSAAAYHDQNVYQWQGSLPTVDTLPSSQAVDWVVKGGRLELPDRGQARVRGLFLRARSAGEPVSIADRFDHGLLNATFQTDFREWTSQLADYSMGLAVGEKSGVRSRMLGITAAVAQRTFNNVATWSSTASPLTGNFLIDDEQVDTRSVSLSARGETFTAMLFGHVRDKAQSMIVDGMTIAVRAVGTIRRWGR